MTVLIIGFAAVVLLMVAVVTDISKAFLVRRDLDATADGAVLAAANGLALHRDQTGATAEIDLDEATRLTGEYLEAVNAESTFDGLTWSTTVDGQTVIVTLTSTVDLPFEPPGWDTTPEITSNAAAIIRLN
ncbi:pilus assembly protein TadG-related protein [Kribbella sp. NBC_01245]|uniref:pilus assembly protein TadG-related protein n=1 Tax=Kribbella sp. NBC_01245 TaxID=2903578 RepID=UPI002E2C93E7|nr:pilus assembly protein TadG-related protein [Kribbella sp. NBC_01245]